MKIILFPLLFVVLFGSNFIAADLNSVGCSAINGEYLSLGKSNSTFSEFYITPSLEKNIFREGSSYLGTYSVSISLDDLNKILKLVFKDINGKILGEHKRVDPYVCKDGHLIYTFETGGGSGESTMISTTTIIEFFQAKNGFEVYTQSINIYRSWFFFEKKRVFDVKYVFESKKK